MELTSKEPTVAEVAEVSWMEVPNLTGWKETSKRPTVRLMRLGISRNLVQH